MVFSATFNNISVISCRWVLLVEETDKICRWFSPVSPTNKTDRHYIATEILLKVALSTINELTTLMLTTESNLVLLTHTNCIIIRVLECSERKPLVTGYYRLPQCNYNFSRWFLYCYFNYNQIIITFR